MEIDNELLQKVLSLVLDVEVVKINSTSNNHVNYDVYGINGDTNHTENLDAVNRICREWIVSDSHEKFLCNINAHQTYEDRVISVTMFFNENEEKKQFVGASELEEMLKATDWVASKKFSS